MTKYIDNHPGGVAILRQAGGDATLAVQQQSGHKVFTRFIEDKIKSLQIGTIG